MQVTVLGKYGPYGKAGVGAASGYLVEDDDFKLLLDMGSGVLTRLIDRVNVKDLDGIFVSHLHFDHTSDRLPFRYLLDETGTKVKIYTEKQESEWYKILFRHPLFDIVNIKDGDSIRIKGVKITFFRMQHPSPDLAIRLESKSGTICYTGDTVFNKNLYPLLDGADLAIVDCSKPAHFIGGHMPATVAKKLKEETTVKTILASHAAPDFDPETVFKGMDGVVFAEEGRTYRV